VYIAGSPKRVVPIYSLNGIRTQKAKIQNVLYVFKLKKKHNEGSIIYDRKISDHNNICLIKQIILFEGKK
jgi:hypothetical protein